MLCTFILALDKICLFQQYVITFEEYVIATKHYLNYLAQTIKALESDDSLIGISAWNENGLFEIASHSIIAVNFLVFFIAISYAVSGKGPQHVEFPELGNFGIIVGPPLHCTTLQWRNCLYK